MKTATVRYIANGYTLMATTDTLHPPPVWVFAADLNETIYYLDQYFVAVNPEGTPPPGYQPLVFDISTIADAAANPLLNQEAVVWPALPQGFVVKQLPNFSDPGRKVVDQYCPTMDDVFATLTAIFTPTP